MSDSPGFGNSKVNEISLAAYLQNWNYSEQAGASPFCFLVCSFAYATPGVVKVTFLLRRLIMLHEVQFDKLSVRQKTKEILQIASGTILRHLCELKVNKTYCVEAEDAFLLWRTRPKLPSTNRPTYHTKPAISQKRNGKRKKNDETMIHLSLASPLP